MTRAGLDYLNSPATADLAGPAVAEVLASLVELQGRLAAAHARFLARFDAADGHDADGYGSSSAWLAAKTQLTKRDARRAVRQMRQLGVHRDIADALAAGEISQSWGFQIAEWTRKLPAELCERTDKILLEAAAAGADLADLATIAAAAIESWRGQQPDSGDDGFEDRYVQVGTTFGGAGIIRGDLTPECAAAVQAVLEALGKKAGPEDYRNEGQRLHDALQLGCELLLRGRLVPDRAGADTQVIAHIPLSQLRNMPGAPELEQAWLNARLGEPGYLTGKDAEAAACDAQTVPVVTGQPDPDAIDKIIALSAAALDKPAAALDRDAGTLDEDPGTTCEPPRLRPMSPEAAQALRHAIARLAIGFVSGPNGIASQLRTGLLKPPYTTPSLPLDIGYSASIPAHIRRAALLRDKGCAWPRCGRPAAHCDVHHICHKRDGGHTSVAGVIVLCQFHHDVCVHRNGWQIILHPDGTTEARSPDGGQILRSHAPPAPRAA